MYLNVKFLSMCYSLLDVALLSFCLLVNLTENRFYVLWALQNLKCDSFQ